MFVVLFSLVILFLLLTGLIWAVKRLPKARSGLVVMCSVLLGWVALTCVWYAVGESTRHARTILLLCAVATLAGSTALSFFLRRRFALRLAGPCGVLLILLGLVGIAFSSEGKIVGLAIGGTLAALGCLTIASGIALAKLADQAA